ncbi:hypothetical protein QFC22_002413 [Naganishia vaughanmartiniae]|uniref:Uncharacterized protein n=1 Tax=Naganishia vaughanmartiniae TaxID=1424756 RepID=A0ACC2XDQ8_9TREE|nr:hypothetical protein QFC22_002413 [Naganishia vaughanmartiniae]
MAFVAKGSIPVRFVDDGERTLQETNWDNLPEDLLNLKLLLNEALDLRYSQEIHLEHQRNPGFFMPVVDEIDYRGLIERLASATTQQIVRVLVYNKTDGIPVTPVRTVRTPSYPLVPQLPSSLKAGHVQPQNATPQVTHTPSSTTFVTPSMSKEKANTVTKPAEIVAPSPAKEVRFQPLSRSSLSTSITAEDVMTQSDTPEVNEEPSSLNETPQATVVPSGEVTKKRKRSSEDEGDVQDIVSAPVPAEKTQIKKQKINEAGDSASLPAQAETSENAATGKATVARAERRRLRREEELKKLRAAETSERDLQLARQIERDISTQASTVVDSEEGNASAKMLRKKAKRAERKQRQRDLVGEPPTDVTMDETMDETIKETFNESTADEPEDGPAHGMAKLTEAVLPDPGREASAEDSAGGVSMTAATTIPPPEPQSARQIEREVSAQGPSLGEPSGEGASGLGATPKQLALERRKQANLLLKQRKKESKRAKKEIQDVAEASTPDISIDVTLDHSSGASPADDNVPLPEAVLPNTANETSAPNLPSPLSTLPTATPSSPGKIHRKRKDTRVSSQPGQSANKITKQNSTVDTTTVDPSPTSRTSEVQPDSVGNAVNMPLAGSETTATSAAPRNASTTSPTKKSKRKERKKASEESTTPAAEIPSADSASTPSQKSKAKARLSSAAAALAEWRAKHAVIETAQPISATATLVKPNEVLSASKQLPAPSTQGRAEAKIQPLAEDSQWTPPSTQRKGVEITPPIQPEETESEEAETPPASSAQIPLPRSSQRPARLPSSSPESYPSDSEESQDAWQKAHRRMRTPGSDDLEPEGDDEDEDEDDVRVDDSVEDVETNKTTERPTPDVISSFPIIDPASMEIDNIVEDDQLSSSSAIQHLDRSPTPQAGDQQALEAEAESADQASLPSESEMTAHIGTPNLFSSTQNPIIPLTQTQKRPSLMTLTDLAAPTSPIMPSTGVAAFQDAMDEDAAADQAAMDSVTAVEETSASDSNSNVKTRGITKGNGLSIDSALSQSINLSQNSAPSPRRLRSRTREPQSQTDLAKTQPVSTLSLKKRADVQKVLSQPVSTPEEPEAPADSVSEQSSAPAINGHVEADHTRLTSRKERRMAASQSRIPALSSLSADALRKGRASRFSTAIAPKLTNGSATQPNPTRASAQNAPSSDTDEDAHDDTDSDSDSDDERQNVTASLPANLAKRVAGGTQTRKPRQSLGQMQGW